MRLQITWSYESVVIPVRSVSTTLMKISLAFKGRRPSKCDALFQLLTFTYLIFPFLFTYQTELTTKDMAAGDKSTLRIGEGATTGLLSIVT